MNGLDEVKKYLECAVNIFPENAPGSENVDFAREIFEEASGNNFKIIAQNTSSPVIIPFIPENGNGTAVIVIPGGAFKRQVVNQEGIDIAQWLNSLGITAFVLLHRLPVNDFPNREDVTLIDVQRAIRYVRFNSLKWNIDSCKIGVMGFSAGGHLASLVSTSFDKKVYESVDKVDNISARPDFCVLGYPAICLETEEMAARLKNLPGGVPEHIKAVLEKYSTDTLVTKETCPAFIFETDDDKTTPSEHSIRFYLACRRSGVPAELHIFRTGAHGFGLSEEGRPESEWKRLFINWGKSLKIL